MITYKIDNCTVQGRCAHIRGVGAFAIRRIKTLDPGDCVDMIEVVSIFLQIAAFLLEYCIFKLIHIYAYLMITQRIV